MRKERSPVPPDAAPGIRCGLDRVNGQPCVRNLRMIVRRVVEAVANYPDSSDLKREYPELDDEDVRHALIYMTASLDDRLIDTKGGGEAAA